MLELKIALKPKVVGRYESPEDWTVEAAYDRWHQPGIRVEKPERRMTDIAIGRMYLGQLKANREAAAGPVQAEPMPQGPAAGSDPTVSRALEQSVAAYLNPNSAARAYGEARDAIIEGGRNSIPALLNTLVERDHSTNDVQIREANMAIMMLREITGESFGYAPGQAKGMGQSLVTATAEERNLAVRRWFGWWNTKGRSFTKKATAEEGEDK
jgi:hypothetical protein